MSSRRLTDGHDGVNQKMVSWDMRPRQLPAARAVKMNLEVYQRPVLRLKIGKMRRGHTAIPIASLTDDGTAKARYPRC